MGVVYDWYQLVVKLRQTLIILLWMNQEPFMEKSKNSDFENQSTESKIKLNGENKVTEN